MVFEIVLQQSLRDFPVKKGLWAARTFHGRDRSFGVGFQQKAPGTGLQSLPDQIVGIVHGENQDFDPRHPARIWRVTSMPFTGGNP